MARGFWATHLLIGRCELEDIDLPTVVCIEFGERHVQDVVVITSSPIFARKWSSISTASIRRSAI